MPNYKFKYTPPGASGTTNVFITEASLAAAQAHAASFVPIGSGGSIDGGILSEGKYGVADGGGEFTFYDKFQDAIDAAVAGQTAKAFVSEVEAADIAINLKDGVNIDLNGNTYTLDFNSQTNAFQDNGVPVKCGILDGVIRRINGLNTDINNSTALKLTEPSSEITLLGVRIENTVGTGIKNGAKMYKALAVCDNGIGIYNGTDGYLNDSVGESKGDSGIKNDEQMAGCRAKTEGGSNAACINTGIVKDSLIESTITSVPALENHALSIGNKLIGSPGLALNNIDEASVSFDDDMHSDGEYACTNNGVLINPKARSLADVAILNTSTGEVYGGECISTANYGAQNNGGKMSGTRIKSTANKGAFSNAPGSRYYDCTIESNSGAALGIFDSGDVEIVGCTLISTLDDPTGHAIEILNPSAGADMEITDCNLRVKNAAANAVSSGNAINVKYVGNKSKGMTTELNANITNTQANNADAFGNILVG